MLYPGSRFRMADELLENYIRQLIEVHHTPKVIAQLKARVVPAV